MPQKEDLDIAVKTLKQDLVWVEIKNMRALRKASGVYVSNYWFHSNDTSRIQFLALVMMGANMPTGIMWKTMSGDFVAMTPALAGAIFQQIMIQDTQTFTVCEQHGAAMFAAADPLAYDYSVGATPAWPQVFTDLYPNIPIY